MTGAPRGAGGHARRGRGVPGASALLASALLASALLASALLAVALAAAPVAAAQDGVATVRVDGRSVLRVVPADTLGAGARATRVERRVARLLERPDALGVARVVPGPGPDEWTVSVSGVPVVTATPADAEEHLTTADALARRWAAALDVALERGAGRRRTPWDRFTADVQASVTGAFGRLRDSAVTVVPRAFAAALVLGLFWALARGVRGLMRWAFRRVVDDLTVENLVRQVASTLVWALGLLVALGALGLDLEASIAGLGLTGLALGFALKDILSNFMAGLLLLVLRPFRIGDQIVVGETEGAVERVTLRATEIRTYGGRLVLVPNADVFTSRVTNNTASPVRRGSVTLFVGYDEDLRAVADALVAAARRVPDVLEEPPPSVRVRELGADDVELVVRFWADSRRSDYVGTASAVRSAVVDALRAVGVGLPDSTTRVEVVGGGEGAGPPAPPPGRRRPPLR